MEQRKKLYDREGTIWYIINKLLQGVASKQNTLRIVSNLQIERYDFWRQLKQNSNDIEIQYVAPKCYLKKYKQNNKHFTISFKDTKKLVSRKNYMVIYMPTRRCMSRRGKFKSNGGM